jgi:hypothetical protein
LRTRATRTVAVMGVSAMTLAMARAFILEPFVVVCS